MVFGGLQGLEAAVANDDKLQIDDPEFLFDHYVNVLPKQGSRTIRTEEALLIAMSTLQDKFNPNIQDVEEEQIKEALPRSEDTGLAVPKPGQTKMANKRKWIEEKDNITEQTMQHEAPHIRSTTKEKKNKNNPFETTNCNNDVFESNIPLDTVDDFEVVSNETPAVKTSKSCDSDDLSRFD